MYRLDQLSCRPPSLGNCASIPCSIGPIVCSERKLPLSRQGRVFFVCARAAGKAPEGRCDHFQWASPYAPRKG